MTDTTSAPVLVTAATGKTGSRVAARLAARGIPVRAAARSTTPPFDWEDRSTWAPALDGVAAAYLAFAPDLAIPGAPETIEAFTEQAVAAGAGRLVLLSGRGEEEAERAERAFAAAAGAGGVAHTIVRASFFAQNFSESFLADGIAQGEVVLPVGAVPEPFADAGDIADVAVAALTEPGHAGRLYEVTGPRALTFAEATAEMARATGREVAYVQVPVDAWTAGLRAEGLPEDVVGLLAYLFTEVLDGRNARPADGVRQALGREPRTFEAYAREAAGA